MKIKRKFTPEEVEQKINEYFKITDKDEWTITGLCLHIGINKDTFYEYVKLDEYMDATSKARLMVEHSYELSLRKNGRSGDIFALKNFGWTDKQEIEQVNVNVEAELTEEEADAILKKYDIRR